jgi:spore maturation protein A
MLNYIWISLIVLGLLVALTSDWHDLSVDKYHNDSELAITFHLIHPFPNQPQPSPQKYSCLITVTPEDYKVAYGITISDTIRQMGEFITTKNGESSLRISLDEKSPGLWKELAKSQKDPEYLIARTSLIPPNGVPENSKESVAMVRFDPIRFVKLNSVTNDGIVGSAKTAVELAIGLIGIMALWLGLMKVAEKSGLVALLANALKPVTKRLFPDVPSDHPAMGAMILNISANMLGLANAATPLGLKAMKELNKINPKAGTATDAMCTFLVINTSNVQIIPATVIAIRAAAGSANPTEIIGPVIVATFVSLIIGVTIVKLLARLPMYKNQLKPTA